MQSRKFSLNTEDLKRWGHNALVFAGPAILVLLASAMKAVPADWQFAVVVLYVLNVLTDLLKKFLAGQVK